MWRPTRKDTSHSPMLRNFIPLLSLLQFNSQPKLCDQFKCPQHFYKWGHFSPSITVTRASGWTLILSRIPLWPSSNHCINCSQWSFKDANLIPQMQIPILQSILIFSIAHRTFLTWPTKSMTGPSTSSASSPSPLICFLLLIGTWSF